MTDLKDYVIVTARERLPWHFTCISLFYCNLCSLLNAYAHRHARSQTCTQAYKSEHRYAHSNTWPTRDQHVHNILATLRQQHFPTHRTVLIVRTTCLWAVSSSLSRTQSTLLFTTARAETGGSGGRLWGIQVASFCSRGWNKRHHHVHSHKIVRF